MAELKENKEQEIKAFIDRWKGRGHENQDARSYWIELLDLLGVNKPTTVIEFEKTVFVDGKKRRIDALMPATKTLIEQKSVTVNLDDSIRQSDKTLLTPYQQAKRYADNLPYSEKPNRIIVCNFEEIRIYDLDSPRPELGFIAIKLGDLDREISKLKFLKDFSEEKIRKEEEVSIKAGKLVKKLYDALREQFYDKDSPETLRALNILCVRLVFMMYAEDADVFNKDQFRDYVKKFHSEHLRNALLDLFKQLNIKKEDRKYVSPDVDAFPYVNGGLFKEETEIPQFTEEIASILYEAMDFDWRSISAPIFGACYESTINPETRHQNGMHYTKSEDVAKLLDNLFLDDFRAELSNVRTEPNNKKRIDLLRSLQNKIASIGIADFAAGSGNFGVEAYMSLRRIENEILLEITKAKTKSEKSGQMAMVFNEADAGDRVKVSINQIHLAEINDFACDVAKVALWIAEAQMMKETKRLMKLDNEENFLPLTTNANVKCCDSLTTPWENIVPKDQVDYIVQNPPYLGYSKQSPEQKKAIRSIYVDENGKEYRNAGKIDFVAGWMFKAAEYIKGTNIRCAFVTTNSVTQGEQVASIWKPLYERFGIHIDFAYQSFKWNNGTEDMAQVVVVIFGFSCAPRHKHYLLYDKDAKPKVVEIINPYLKDRPIVFIESRTAPLCKLQKPAVSGLKPADGGFLQLSLDEYEQLTDAEKAVCREMIKGDEHIKNKKMYCIWLDGVSPHIYRNMPTIYKKVKQLKVWRENQVKTGDAYKLKDIITFRPGKGVNPDNPYIFIPRHTTKDRDYIPFDYITSGSIPNDSCHIICNAELLDFGMIQSSVHMLWIRETAGGLGEGIRYTKDIVLNNYPWPNTLNELQKIQIETTAQGILDARAKYPDASLADLYDPITMPIDLRNAHKANDKAVMDAYGFRQNMSDDEIVAELMKMYQQLCKK